MTQLAIKKLNTSDDFLTPPELVEAMGMFDLDPCSSHRQERPLATLQYRFPEDNGLLLPWTGSVFVNPPFSELQSWVSRFILHADGVMLVPARVEVGWFWKLWQHCDGIFLTKGPVKYLCPDGKSSPRFFRRRVLRDRQRECRPTSQNTASWRNGSRKIDAMTAEQVAMHFNAKKVGRGKWMALCSAHPDRHRSLSIAEGKKGVLIRCMSMGCDTRDVLRAAGLTMEALFYDSGRKVDAKEWAETQRKAREAEERAANLRIGEWVVRFIDRGYTREDRDRDMTVIAACAIVLSNKPDRTWEGILRTTLERIAAADECMSRRMLPAVAKERSW